MPADAFELEPPADAKMSSYDPGYHFGSLETLSSGLAFFAMEPAYVPEGFNLTDVATAPRDGSLRDWAQNTAPPSILEPATVARLELWYRHGFETLHLNMEPVLPQDAAVSREEVLAGLRRPTFGMSDDHPGRGSARGSDGVQLVELEDAAALLVTADELTVWIVGDAAYRGASEDGELARRGGPMGAARHVSCKFRNFLATLVFWSRCRRGKTPANRHNALVAQWIEHRFPKSAAWGVNRGTSRVNWGRLATVRRRPKPVRACSPLQN